MWWHCCSGTVTDMTLQSCLHTSSRTCHRSGCKFSVDRQRPILCMARTTSTKVSHTCQFEADVARFCNLTQFCMWTNEQRFTAILWCRLAFEIRSIGMQYQYVGESIGSCRTSRLKMNRIVMRKNGGSKVSSSCQNACFQVLLNCPVGLASYVLYSYDCFAVNTSRD